MKELSSRKVYLVILYTLIIILLFLICYDIFIFITKKYSNKVPFNAIRVSPITGEHILVSNTKFPLIEINYDNGNFDNLSYIKYADITVEKFNSSNNMIDYTAYLYDKQIRTSDNIKSIKSISTGSFPKLSFDDKTNINKNELKKVDDINIKYNDNLSTSFSYNNNYYKKSDTLSPDYANIVVEYVPDNTDINHIYDAPFSGLLFSNGFCSSFKYNGKQCIFDDKNHISFAEGKTYWIILSKGASLKTN